MSNTETSMAFSDEVIGQIARAVQLAIITGTDVVDNLRMMRVETDEETGLLVLTDEYREIASGQIEKLMQEAEAFQAESE
tara:strand:- start:278 stop:517 length:240 start_codon:yes stop_codon:yes gene_type:complete